MTDLFPYPKVLYRNGILDFIWGNMPATCVCLEHKRVWSEGKNYDEGACIECITRAFKISSSGPHAWDRLPKSALDDPLYHSSFDLEVLSPSQRGRIRHTGYAEYGL